MITVGVREAKNHFGELLRKAEKGETVIITRRGVPVAQIEPIRPGFEDAIAAMQELRKFRQDYHLSLGDGVTIKDLIEDGRR